MRYVLRRKTLLGVAVSGLALLGAALGLLARSLAAPVPALPAPAPPVWVAANGRVEGAREELALRPEVTGTLRTIAVRANQDVAAGTLLVQLENDVQHAKVRKAAAQVQSQAADVARLEDVVKRARKSGVGVSAADRTQSEALLAKAQADLGVAQADLALAQAELAKTQLRAPWAGRVLRVYDAPGALAGPASARPILLMADVSRRRVRAFVEELDALRVQPGQYAVVTMDGLPGREFPGRVSAEVLWRMEREAPQSEAPGEYQDIYHRAVLIDLDDGHELPLNLRVNVRIQLMAAVGPHPSIVE